MSKRNLLKWASSALISVVMALSVSGQTFAASQVRDYDSNAVIYGGTYSVSELNKKLNDGTGKSHQSSADLKALFAKYGIKQSDFGQLKDGYVNKKNQVIVNGKVVASNVYTMGRHDISGSTKISGLSYPLYLRHPSVSFLSDSLPAFVSMNYDNTYAYAILKPCGNIVVGPGVKVKPTPVPVKPVTPIPVTPIARVVVTTPAAALPNSGPLDSAVGALGITITGGASLAWLKSKRSLLKALKKF